MKTGSFGSAVATLAACAAVLFLTSGCTAKMRVERHLKRAENYDKAADYEKAKIEYLNVLRNDQRNQRAWRRVGAIWLEQGAPLRAGPFLYRATELDPSDVESRLKLGRAYVSLGDAVDAHRQAAIVLQQNPGHPDALLLAAESSRTTEDIAHLRSELQRATDRNSVNFHLASSTLALRMNNLAEAQAALRRAAEVDPSSPLPHTGLATFYIYQKNIPMADAELKAAADASGMRSPERVRYAEFKASIGQVDAGRAIMKEVVDKVPDFMPAYRLLAQINLAEKKFDEALAVLDGAFRVDPDNPDCRLVEAEVWMGKGDPAKAAQVLDRLDKAYPNVPMVKMQLARAYAVANDFPTSASILNGLITANPGFSDAVLALAEINLRMGDYQAVVNSMNTLLEKQPTLLRAAELLAEGHRGLGATDDAAAVYRAQINAAPQDPQPNVALGMLLRQQKKLDEAQPYFEKALELAPNPAVADQLVEVQLERNDVTGALRTVEREMARTPNVAALYDTEGKIYASRQQWQQAEAAFTKALELDPNLTAGYDHLIALYIATNRLPEAAAKLETLAARTPVNPSVLMILGLVAEKQNDFAKARDAYEKVLAVKPDFPPALNNLAYIYSEKLPQLEKAAELARKARALQPGDAAMADTLGWVLYKQGDYQQAAALLLEAATKLPENPEVQFHYGMAAYMMGQTEPARAALRKAVDAPTEFPGKDEAQKRLTLLAQGIGPSAAMPVGDLEAQLKSQPNDLIALVRAGEAYEQQGDIAKAAASYERALTINPKLLQPTLKVAEFYAGALQNKPKALEYAKKARELAPSDPEVTRVLGRVAFQSGNWSWAYSLLQESSRHLAENPQVQYDFAWAAYSIGKLPEAQQAMQRVIDVGAAGGEAEDARTFVNLVSAETSAGAAGQAQETLRAKPDYVPALMVDADVRRARGDAKAAEEVYTRVLQRFPEFAPAMRELARIYSVDPATNAKAYELATKARKALPDDPELGRILGAIHYRKKDYTQAVQAFQLSARKKPLDAQSLFFYGMAQMNARQQGPGRQTLEQALAAGLAGSEADEARRALEAKP